VVWILPSRSVPKGSDWVFSICLPTRNICCSSGIGPWSATFHSISCPSWRCHYITWSWLHVVRWWLWPLHCCQSLWQAVCHC
jgi:hypothetical protein